ncbi:capsular polysaccharide biosynthesis protein [Stutzerimonas degradans]|uniref:capsular polysaccharide export protein, LipB/KpsS family n=1 Tax=Stutzerimonas degradans TaxID=2968968 RepID=UPI00028E9979|nr:capsular polysaccharide biosynthesis protein [Stutzerimonas degradans]EKM94848.1 capsule polysaccharide biosynthesis [Stutzerimonas degradans]
MKVVFLGLAKHQINYFSALLENSELTGTVVTPAKLPLPSAVGLQQALCRVEWQRLIKEKCAERAIKGRYHGVVYRLLLRLEMLVLALRFGRFLRKERPDAVAVWNGGHRYCSLLTSMCEADVLRLYFENGLLPGTTTVDPRGVNYRNSVPRDAAFYRSYAERYPGRLRGAEPVALIPRETKRQSQSVELPGSYIFIPFQDDWDTQIRLFSPWISDMRELFSFAELVAQRSGKVVVLKEHPSSRVKYPDLVRRASDRVIFANGNSTQELIEKADCVVTINSTVGLESILLAKPVLVLGEAFYAVEGVAARARNAEEALALLENLSAWDLSEELQQAFVSYLRDEYCLPGHWRDGGAEHYAAVARRIEALAA